MTKRAKGCTMFLGLAGTLWISGCPVNLENLARDLRDAAVDGTADAVRDAAFDFVDDALPEPSADDDAE